MNREDKIQQEVQKTLDCFDKIEPLKANPFFYTRLKIRINDLNTQKGRFKKRDWVTGILQPALLTLVIAVNVVTAIVFFSNQNDNYSGRTQLLNAFAREMTLDSNEYNPNLFNLKQE